MKKTTDTARSQHAVTVALASIAVFLVVMAFLAWRLEVGVDPAIGSPVAQADQQQVVKRKLIVERKIIKVVRDRPALPPKVASGGSASGGGTVASSGSGSYSAPAAPAPSYSSPAPAQSTPAPAAAPAPAPTTSAS